LNLDSEDQAKGEIPVRPQGSVSHCKQCGECLMRCPVMSLEAEQAAESITRLAGGQYVHEVLDRCTGCMSCDAFCSNGASPYGLLLERYHERYLSSGISSVFCNAMPQRDGPNIWHSLGRWLSASEKRDLARWSRPPHSEGVLFLGCNQRLTPYIADTRLFDDVTIFVDPDECCGEFYLRLGLLEEAKTKAASLARRFREAGVRKVVAFCPACQNTMQNLAPRLLGVTFDVEVTGLVEWLAGRLASGDITPVKRLAGGVAVQDPCHASGIGAGAINEVRRLLGLLDLSVVEFETSGVRAECCGLGASLARYRITDVLRTGMHISLDSRRTGASIACAWCNGCYMVMNMFRLLHPAAPPVYHLLELVQIAAGEKPRRKTTTRSAQLLASAVEAAARDRFRFGEVYL
jgi:Fe-S oxidoreductase